MQGAKLIFMTLACVALGFGCADDSDGLTAGQGDATTDSGPVADGGAFDDGIIHEDPPMDAASPDAESPDGNTQSDSGPDAGPVDDGVCVPDCWLKACGDDGCGGTCGTCLAGASCNGEGRCDCPASTCGTSVCGVSSCGANCGKCSAQNGEVCDNGACVTACANGAGSCRDLASNQICEGQLGRGTCTTDRTRTAACACEPLPGGSRLECEDCYINAPIHCRNGDCLDSEQCNEWTGKCEPAGLPSPPPGGDNGDPCVADSDCRSFGAHGPTPEAPGDVIPMVPQCLTDWNGGYCMSYCNAPPDGFLANGDLHQANCPAGSLCLSVAWSGNGGNPEPPGQGACSKECFADSDCREAEGYYCRHEFPLQMSTTRGVCAPNHCVSRGCASYVCGC